MGRRSAGYSQLYRRILQLLGETDTTAYDQSGNIFGGISNVILNPH